MLDNDCKHDQKLNEIETPPHKMSDRFRSCQLCYHHYENPTCCTKHDSMRASVWPA